MSVLETEPLLVHTCRMKAQLLGISDHFKKLNLPFFTDAVRAGFPSPAADHVEKTLDLNELCVQHPSATYFVRAEGSSMVERGIFPGSVLVVDRSLTARHGDVVIASVDGEFTVKTLELKPAVRLIAGNVDFKPIEFNEESELDIFGVVTNVIHSLRG